MWSFIFMWCLQTFYVIQQGLWYCILMTPFVISSIMLGIYDQLHLPSLIDNEVSTLVRLDLEMDFCQQEKNPGNIHSLWMTLLVSHLFEPQNDYSQAIIASNQAIIGWQVSQRCHKHPWCKQEVTQLKDVHMTPIGQWDCQILGFP